MNQYHRQYSPRRLLENGYRPTLYDFYNFFDWPADREEEVKDEAKNHATRSVATPRKRWKKSLSRSLSGKSQRLKSLLTPSTLFNADAPDEQSPSIDRYRTSSNALCYFDGEREDYCQEDEHFGQKRNGLPRTSMSMSSGLWQVGNKRHDRKQDWLPRCILESVECPTNRGQSADSLSHSTLPANYANTDMTSITNNTSYSRLGQQPQGRILATSVDQSESPSLSKHRRKVKSKTLRSSTSKLFFSHSTDQYNDSCRQRRKEASPPNTQSSCLPMSAFTGGGSSQRHPKTQINTEDDGVDTMNVERDLKRKNRRQTSNVVPFNGHHHRVGSDVGSSDQSKERQSSGGRRLLNFFFQRGFTAKRSKETVHKSTEPAKSECFRFGGSEDNLDIISRKSTLYHSSSTNLLLPTQPTILEPDDSIHQLNRLISLPPDLLLTLAISSDRSTTVGQINPTQEPVNFTNSSLARQQRIEILPIDSSLQDASCKYYFQVITHRPVPNPQRLSSTLSPPYHHSPSALSTSSSPTCDHVQLSQKQSTVARPSTTDQLANQIDKSIESRSLVRQTFSCHSARERDRWMLYLKRLANPLRDQQRRVENCFQLWIQEAKGFDQGYRYYCQILLDNVLHARTTVKRAGDMLFWGEEFNLSGLPPFNQLTIELWRCGKAVVDQHPKRPQSSPSSLGSHQLRRRRRKTFTELSCNSEQNGDGACEQNGCPLHANGQQPSSFSDVGDLISWCAVPISKLSSTTRELESWYPTICINSPDTRPVKTKSSKKSKRRQRDNRIGSDPPGVQLRFKTRYRQLVVLPLSVYHGLHRALTNFVPPAPINDGLCVNPNQGVNNSIALLTELDNLLSVKSKGDLAGSLVSLHQTQGHVTDFLVALILNEVTKEANPNMVLRSNSIATKATELYLRLTGQHYLLDVLGDFVAGVMQTTSSNTCPGSTNIDYEVDPARLKSASQLETNQSNLLRLIGGVWQRIVNSSSNFPRELRQLFSAVRSHLNVATTTSTLVPAVKTTELLLPTSCFNPPTAGLIEHVLSACLFLRFICPAILSPSLFGLASEFPTDPRMSRTFTLVAKSIQSLANFSPLDGVKEGYMTFVNSFVSSQLGAMRHFLHSVSTWHPLTNNNNAPRSNGLGPSSNALQHRCQEQPHYLSSQQNKGTNLMSTSLILPSPETSASRQNACSNWQPVRQRMGPSWSHHDGFLVYSGGGGEGSLFRPREANGTAIVRSKSGLPSTTATDNNQSNFTFAEPNRLQIGQSDDLEVIDQRRASYDNQLLLKQQSRHVLHLPNLPPGRSGQSRSSHIVDDSADLAVCLALAHSQLVETFDKTPEEKLTPLMIRFKALLDEISSSINSHIHRDSSNVAQPHHSKGLTTFDTTSHDNQLSPISNGVMTRSFDLGTSSLSSKVIGSPGLYQPPEQQTHHPMIATNNEGHLNDIGDYSTSNSVNYWHRTGGITGAMSNIVDPSSMPTFIPQDQTSVDDPRRQNLIGRDGVTSSNDATHQSCQIFTHANSMMGQSTNSSQLESPSNDLHIANDLELATAYAVVPITDDDAEQEITGTSVITRPTTFNDEDQKTVPQHGQSALNVYLTSPSSGYHSIESHESSVKAKRAVASPTMLNGRGRQTNPPALKKMDCGLATLVPESIATIQLHRHQSQHIYANLPPTKATRYFPVSSNNNGRTVESKQRVGDYLASLHATNSVDSLHPLRQRQHPDEAILISPSPSPLDSVGPDDMHQASSSLDQGLNASQLDGNFRQGRLPYHRSSMSDQRASVRLGDGSNAAAMLNPVTVAADFPLDVNRIHSELSASQARVAAAQERLLANEAERMSILQDWRSELVRQSQLVNARAHSSSSSIDSCGDAINRGDCQTRRLTDVLGGGDNDDRRLTLVQFDQDCPGDDEATTERSRQNMTLTPDDHRLDESSDKASSNGADSSSSLSSTSNHRWQRRSQGHQDYHSRRSRTNQQQHHSNHPIMGAAALTMLSSPPTQQHQPSMTDHQAISSNSHNSDHWSDTSYHHPQPGNE